MKRYILSILFSLFVLTTFGQRVNTSATVGANVFGGNWESYLLNSQFSIGQDSTKITWSFNPTLFFGQVKDANGIWNTNQREFYATANATKKWNRNRVIAFGEVENSFLRKIQFRGAIGFGYGFDVINKEKTKLLISESYLIETYQSDINTSKNLTSIRLSTRIKFEHIGKVKITSITLFQPSISSAPPVNFEDNINLRTNNTIEFPLNKTFSIGLQFNGFLSTYSTYVDSNVKSFDYNSLLVFKFKNF
jgi:hypothetical protein